MLAYFFVWRVEGGKRSEKRDERNEKGETSEQRE